MIGAIIGDIAGSSYEAKEAVKEANYEQRIKILDPNVLLFNQDSAYTDDTVLTIALADAILNNLDYEKCIKEYTQNESNLGLEKYGRSRFGKNFIKWAYLNEQGNSFGNGCAMRISPIAFYYDDLEQMRQEVVKATICSHNHEQSIKAALSVADAIFFAKQGYDKQEIVNHLHNYYDLNYDLEDLQRNYKFSALAEHSVPQALYIFSISNDFEDTIRKSISIGGDTDTIAAIAGSIAEAYYGIPENIKEQAMTYLKDEYKEILNKIYKKTRGAL
jgi:ADP-ribosyl-[dinitrogen reductase] hydrolase